MQKKVILILICFLILISGIGMASAETLTGTLGSTGYNVTPYTVIYQTSGGQTVASISNLFIKDIQVTGGIDFLIRYDTNAHPTFTAGSPSGNTTPVIFSIGETQIGTGTFGYQRVFDAGGTEGLGFQYLAFDNWIGATSFTGDQTVSISGLPINGITYSLSALNALAPPFSGAMKFGTSANGWFGNYSINKDSIFLNDYSATKPSGIGITGSVSKSSGGYLSPSRAWVFDGLTNTALTSQSAITNQTLNFSTTAQSIKIGVQDQYGTFYNSSVLFSAGTGTPTPTPTVGPENPIPAGYIRTFVKCVDGRTGYNIYNSNIQLMDVNNNSWSNVSARSDGLWFIDTLPLHTVDAYADATGYTSSMRTGLPVISGGTTYDISLWSLDMPPASSGKIMLYVIVTDSDYHAKLSGVSLTVRDSTGVTQVGTTGESGMRSFEVTNSSLVYVTAAKTGFFGRSVTVSTQPTGTETTRIELQRLIVTTAPTNTIPPGGVTTAVTVNPHDPSITGNTNASAQDMMNWLAANGMQLVQLCFLITILGLLGIKLGK